MRPLSTLLSFLLPVSTDSAPFLKPNSTEGYFTMPLSTPFNASKLLNDYPEHYKELPDHIPFGQEGDNYPHFRTAEDSSVMLHGADSDFILSNFKHRFLGADSSDYFNQVIKV